MTASNSQIEEIGCFELITPSSFVLTRELFQAKLRLIVPCSDTAPARVNRMA